MRLSVPEAAYTAHLKMATTAVSILLPLFVLNQLPQNDLDEATEVPSDSEEDTTPVKSPKAKKLQLDPETAPPGTQFDFE